MLFSCSRNKALVTERGYVTQLSYSAKCISKCTLSSCHPHNSGDSQDTSHLFALRSQVVMVKSREAPADSALCTEQDVYPAPHLLLGYLCHNHHTPIPSTFKGFTQSTGRYHCLKLDSFQLAIPLKICQLHNKAQFASD